MKHFKIILPIFLIVSLLGVYFGVKSKNTEGRKLASPQTELQELFAKRSSSNDRGIISMTSFEGDDYCELIKGIDEYKVILTADGVTSGDLEISVSLEGRCDEQRNLIVFDSLMCGEDASFKKFSDGFDGTNGVFIKGYNLDQSIPTRRLSFFITSLEITYDDQRKETVEPSLDEIKIPYSCEEFFSL